MARSPKYPAELRERAVRMVQEHAQEYPSDWAAIISVAEKIGVNKETLRVWVRRTEIDRGQRPGVTTDEREGRPQPEREHRQARRANETLNAAATSLRAGP